MQRLLAALMLIAALTACERETGTRVDPRAATAVRAPWPRAVAAAPNAPPQILALQISSAQIVPGSDWSGRIATTTNVASLEIRTESFSFNAQRIGFGQFVFDQHVLDVVPTYKRPYLLRVIARNAAGAQDVRLIPIVLR